MSIDNDQHVNSNDSIFNVRTRENSTPSEKPRVYFSCHPEDIEYFDSISSDILLTHDCVIYYAEDRVSDYSETTLACDLNSMNLFVIPITRKLLESNNRVLNADLPFANNHHIPVLPLMMENGLTDLFTEYFGKIQYLTPGKADETAIPYDEKLYNYLNAVLINDEKRKRVQAAFDTCIFLSYRKKDRKFANELMHIIHKNPLCRDIAIWYDEFLTPGEKYDKNIADALNNCDLFALLVTPSLLEDPNYVMNIEYPQAQKAGKCILPIEMYKTDRTDLEKKYLGIPQCILSQDENGLHDMIISALKKIAFQKHKSIPEHDYLIGIAYAEGINVESDPDQALTLITSAAESGLLEAMERLVIYYDNGNTFNNYKNSVKWLQRICKKSKEEYGTDSPDTLNSMIRYGLGLEKILEYKKASEIYQEVYNIQADSIGQEHPDALRTLHLLAFSLWELGDKANRDRSMELYMKEWAGRANRLLHNTFSDYETDSLALLSSDIYMKFSITDDTEKRNKWCINSSQLVEQIRQKTKNPKTDPLLNIHLNACICYSDNGDHTRAIELYNKVYNAWSMNTGFKDESMYILCYMAGEYRLLNDHKKAAELDEKVYKSWKTTLSEIDPHRLSQMSTLAKDYSLISEHSKAVSILEDLYRIQKMPTMYGEESRETTSTMNELAHELSASGNHQRAIELYGKLYPIYKKYESSRFGGEEYRKAALTTLSDLAYEYQCIYDYKQAIALYEEVLAAQKELYGETSINTISALNNLLALYNKTDTP